MVFDYNMAGLDLSCDPAFYTLMAGSFERRVGRPLTSEGEGAEWLYNQSSAVVLAHNSEADPRFIYANRAAQACFGYTWAEFITLQSRLSAEAPDRAERERLLNAVTANGFIADYRGLRIAQIGPPFLDRKCHCLGTRRLAGTAARPGCDVRYLERCKRRVKRRAGLAWSSRLIPRAS